MWLTPASAKVSIWRAQYAEARRHLDLGSSYYDEADRSELGLMGIDAPALAAIVALLLGFPDRARQLMNEGLRRAERRGDSFWMGIVHMWEACFVGFSAMDKEPLSMLRRCGV